jgi:hypothetical protein
VRHDPAVEIEPAAFEPPLADMVVREEEVGRDSAPGAPRTALRAVSGPFWASRLIVFICGAIGSVRVGRAHVALTDLGNLAIAGLDRWDSGWYLSIASTGYRSAAARAFFPLYPLLVRTVGFITGDTYAGVIISMGAFFVALSLLYRLVELDFSSEVAAITVALVAFCPIAFFFSAIYTESLFLALTVGAIYAARRERWLVAGIVGAFASATRNAGVLVSVPIVLLYLYGPRGDARAPRARWYDTRHGLRTMLPRYRLGLQIWPVLLVPMGVLAFTAYLALKYHAGTSWISSEKYWRHESVNPIEGFIQGARAAWSGIHHLTVHASGGGSANWIQTVNLFNFVSCAAGLAALVACLRTLPVAYSAYAAAAFVLPLTSPVSGAPLSSFPRYELVIFPLFICVASALVRRRWVTLAVAGGAVSLTALTVLFAGGTWIA